MEVSNFISAAFVGRIEDEQVAADALRMLRVPASVGYEAVLSRLSPRSAAGTRSGLREFVMRDVDGNVDRMRVDLDHLPHVLTALDTTAPGADRDPAGLGPEQRVLASGGSVRLPRSRTDSALAGRQVHGDTRTEHAVREWSNDGTAARHDNPFRDDSPFQHGNPIQSPPGTRTVVPGTPLVATTGRGTSPGSTGTPPTLHASTRTPPTPSGTADTRTAAGDEPPLMIDLTDGASGDADEAAEVRAHNGWPELPAHLLFTETGSMHVIGLDGPFSAHRTGEPDSAAARKAGEEDPS
jgi:hypothetical protein